MTQAQHKARLRRVIKAWRSRLYMEHITIDINWSEEPEDPEALASIEPSDFYDFATLRFREDWMEHDAEELNHIVVHELLHVLFRDYANAVRSVSVVGSLSSDVRMLWHDRCRDAEEALVDRLANRLIEQGGVVE